MSAQKLLPWIIGKGNDSGSIRSAPQGLLKLKESIEGLPFALKTPSMSGIFDKLQGQMQQLIQSMGGIQNMGGGEGVQQALKQIQQGTASAEQLVELFGGVTAMTAGLAASLPQEMINEIRNIAGNIKNTGT